MKTTYKNILRSVSLMLVTASFTTFSIAQRIPASSADSGRRAIVSINIAQTNSDVSWVYSQTVNAQNTANWAGNVGNWAQTLANNAQNTANYAAGNEITQQFNVQGQHAWLAGLCIRNWGVDYNEYRSNPCPGGSGPYTVHSYPYEVN
jgi:hypothetical protein